MIRDVYAYALTLPEDLRDRASLDAVGTAVDELRQRMGDEAERFLDPSRDAEFRILRRWSSPNDFAGCGNRRGNIRWRARGARASFGPRVRKVGAVR